MNVFGCFMMVLVVLFAAFWLMFSNPPEMRGDTGMAPAHQSVSLDELMTP